MEFTNLTRANEIGANSYLLDFGDDGRLVLDAGMHPRLDGPEALPNLDLLKGKPIDAVFVSHAHHDHIGALPLIMQHQPKARVFMSEPTYFLGDPLLHNSVQIMLKQREELGMTSYPLFTHKQLDEWVKVWQACGLNRSWSLEGYPESEREPLSFTFHDAGHILGSVGIELMHRGRRIFYTGDINFAAQTLMQPASFPTEDIDTLIIETTRGAQPRPEGFSRNGVIDRLVNSIQATFARGGAVLIPIFAMGKTQEILALLYFLQRQGRLPVCPIYIGGLSRTFSQVYDRLAGRSVRSHSNLQLLDDIAPQVIDGRTVRDLKPKRGQIYLISSGMMTEKTLSNVLAQQFLAQERHSIFFVGYCDPESPAGRLRATPRGESVVLSKEYGSQPVLCEVDHFDFTAHAQREDILDYILKVNPRVCVLVHGDAPALAWFQEQLTLLRPAMKVVIPEPGATLTF